MNPRALSKVQHGQCSELPFTYSSLHGRKTCFLITVGTGSVQRILSEIRRLGYHCFSWSAVWSMAVLSASLFPRSPASSSTFETLPKLHPSFLIRLPHTSLSFSGGYWLGKWGIRKLRSATVLPWDLYLCVSSWLLKSRNEQWELVGKSPATLPHGMLRLPCACAASPPGDEVLP